MDIYDRSKASIPIADHLVVVGQGLSKLLLTLNNNFAIKFDQELTELERLLDQNEEMLADLNHELKTGLLPKLDMLSKF